MKRSEMVVKMTEHWLGLFPGDYLEGMGFDKELFDEFSGRMSSLLNMLESHGMKPPVEDMCPVLFTSKHVWENEENER